MKNRAFSLLEMVVVICIIAVIAAFAVPAISSLINGPRMTQASQMLANNVSAARQYATTKNRPVEVRFLRFRDPELPAEPGGAQAGNFAAMQLLEVTDAGVPIPLGNLEFFPQATALCADVRSSLLDPSGTPAQTPKTPSSTTDSEMPRGIRMNYQYISFRFLPNGSTNLAANRNWFVTVVALRDLAKGPQLPPNFFTLQIDPVSGTTRGFRPGLK